MELSISTFLKTFYLFTTATIVIKVSKWVFDYLNKIRVVNNIKGPQMLPFLGCLHILKGKKDWLNQLVYYSYIYKNEPLWRVWFGTNPVYVIHKPESVELILADTRFTAKPYEYNFFKAWLKEGLITSEGEKWQTRRRMLTPAFHFEILEDFLHVMNEQSEILVEKLAKYAKQKKQVDILKVVQLCALDIISETAMGQNVNAQINEDSEYVKAATQIGDVVMARIVNPLLWPDWIFNLSSQGRLQKRILKLVHSYTRNVIMQRAADFEVGDFVPKRAAFMDILLKAMHEDPTMTFDDVQEEVDTFMVTGFDSTAGTACWALYMMGKHPDVQKKAQQEVDQVLGNTSRPLTMDDLKKLDYIECVMKETLRILPSIPFFGRKLTDDLQVGKYKLQKNNTAMIAVYCIHRDERYWPNPERFDPDRFLPENSKDRHPYAYIPFAAGRRNCIGQRFAQMEEKVVLANILRRFEIKTKQSLAELNPLPEMALRSQKTMFLEFVQRS